jgi:hypothetical protein
MAKPHDEPVLTCTLSSLKFQAREYPAHHQMSSLQEKIASSILSMIRKRRTASVAAEADLHARSSAIAPAKVREVRFSDFDAVSKLKQRWGIAADSLENWERLWHSNPALMRTEVERQIERPMGWVLEANGAVVGYLGNISLQCHYGEKTLTAVVAHGLVVEPSYRAVSLTLTAAFYRQKSVDIYLCTTAVEAVGKMALAFKSSVLPQPDYHSVLFWVIRPYPFTQALMTKLNLGPAGARIGSGLAALAVATDKILRRRWPRRSPGSLTITQIAPTDIGDDFETLWAEKLKESPRLFADRSLATLQWHFEIPGDRGCCQVFCCHKGGELVGYAMLRTDTDPRNGLIKSVIADTLVRQDDPQIVKALWAAAYESAKQTGSHVLEVLGFPPSIRKACSEWNPYLRKYPASPYYYKAADPALHAALSDGNAWYATPFDGDETLIRPSYSSSELKSFRAERAGKLDSTDTVPQVPEQQRTEVC